MIFSIKLKKASITCLAIDVKINHFLFADDKALISPKSSGLQKLLKIVRSIF